MWKRISILVALAVLLAVAAPSLYAQQAPAAEQGNGKSKALDANAGRKDDARINQPLAGKAAPKQEAAEPPLVTKPERIPVNVVLNSQELGDHIAVVLPDGNVMVSPDLIPFKEPPPVVDFEGEPHVSLSALAPGLLFQLEANTLVLNISADPSLFKKFVFDFARAPGNYELAESAGAYINYSLGYSMGSEDEFLSMSLPWEVAIPLAGGSAFSSFVTTRVKTDQGVEEESVRGDTNITWDFPGGPTTLILGDVSGASGPLGGGAQLGGLRLFRNFGLTPYMVTHQRLRLGAVADSPSEVDILINGRYRETVKVPPGEFDLLNIPGAQGLGDATLIIKDAFGRVKRVTIPFFVSTELLPAGVHEFDYSFGSKRVGLGSDSNEYGTPSFTGFHRFGLFNFLSTALSAEVGANQTTILDIEGNPVVEENDVLNGGMSTNFGIGSLGQIDLDVAYSRQEQGDGEEPLLGRAASLTYSVFAGFLSFSFSGQSFTPHYATLSQGAAAEGKLGRSWSVGLGASLGLLGLASARQAHSEGFDGSQSLATSLSYSLSLGGSVSVSTSADRFQSVAADGEETERLSISGGISMSLGNHNVNLDQSANETGQVTRRASVQNGGSSTGFAYSLAASRITNLDGSEFQNGQGTLQYNGPFGTYTASQQRSVQGDANGNFSNIERSSDFSISGAIAQITGNFYHTRSISDGFALVRVARLPGVRVYANGQNIGVTDEDGEVLAPNVTSYLGNELTFEGLDVPVEFAFDQSGKFVAVPTRSGTVVNFDIHKIQAFVGNIFFVEKGKKTSADLAGIIYKVLDAPVESVVGRDGEFYLENIPPGVHPALLKKESLECRFNLVIPESEEVMVELGEVYCEINKK